MGEAVRRLVSTCMKFPFDCIREAYSGIDLEIIKVSLIAVKQAWI